MSSADEVLPPKPLWATDGKQSLLFALHAPETRPSFETAVLSDMVLRGIPVARTIRIPLAAAAGGHADPGPEVSSPAPLSSGKGTSTGRGLSELRGVLPNMATGGPVLPTAGADSSLGSTRASTPLLAHSVSSSSRRQLTTISPSNLADDEERLFTLSAAKYIFDDEVPSVGYCLESKAFVPTNWKNHGNVKNKFRWNDAQWMVAERGSTHLKYLLMVDTGGGLDSWMYCNLSYESLRHHLITNEDGLDAAPWNDEVHKELYENKPKIPVPPDDHLDKETNRAKITYGIKEFKGSLDLAQTIVKLEIDTTDESHSVCIPAPIPVGIALGITPREVCTTHDGILGHGRGFGGKSVFTKQVLWDSKSLVQVMKETRMITANTFTIYIDHPTLAPDMPSCIIYGTPYNPVKPRIVDNWTVLPVHAREWALPLEKIVLHARVNGGLQSHTIRVDKLVQVDSGGSSSYLPEESLADIDEALTAVGPRGNQQFFHTQDEVEFVFGPFPGVGYVSITGQAKSFFDSPYGDENGPVCACASTTGDYYMLGLNFFMTFILSFQDSSMNPRICAQPHLFIA